MELFKSARIRLTALYLLIIFVITFAFSLVVYGMLSTEVERFARSQRFRIENRLNPQAFGRPSVILPADPDLVNEVRKRIAVTLALIDIGILVLSGTAGYFLAGRTLKPISKMVDEQNRFISDASHELRTPLTALKSSFEVFLREKNPDVQSAKQIIKEGVEDVDNLSALASSLLNLSRFDYGNKIKLEPVNLDEVISQSIHKTSHAAKLKEIRIDYRESGLDVLGSKDKLVELFVIILDNATKYSPTKSRVNIESRSEGRSVVVEVKDHGVGISEQDLPHIFNRFYRTDSSRSQTDIPGYGLGLSIAKSIMHEHKGKITAQSKLGAGTTIQLIFIKAEEN